MPRQTAPVSDWTKDFDVLDAGYIEDPFPIWDELRQACPIARTERRRGAWLLTTYADVTAAAHDISTFSSLEVGVIAPEEEPVEDEDNPTPYGLPPISADPPLHTWTRRLLLPWFSHARVEAYEEMTRGLCAELIDDFISKGEADAAADYAQQIPVRVIARILGVPEEMSDQFTGWVRDFLEFADDPERNQRAVEGMGTYLLAEIAARREHPGTDLISELVTSYARRRAAGQRHRPRHRRAGADRGHRHDVERHRLVAVAPGHASRGRGPARGRPRAHGLRGRGAPARVLAGDDGARGHRGHGLPGLPDEEGRQAADELPRREQGSGGVRGGRPR